MSAVRITVASTSAHKIVAVRRAAERLFEAGSASVEGIEAPSGVAEQPIGLAETLAGAQGRLACCRSGGWAIAIESGVVRLGVAPVDVAVILVRDPAGRVVVSLSGGAPLPRGDFEAAREAGFSRRTVGAAMAARTGGSATDPIVYATDGRVTRADLLAEAVFVALSAATGARPWRFAARAHRPEVECQTVRVYVASSWRCMRIDHVLQAVRAAGGQPFDFRNNPNTLLPWRELGAWTFEKASEVEDALADMRTRATFAWDMDGLKSADATLLVMPSGRSAHAELGYAVGAGQRTAVLLADGAEPEVMQLMADVVSSDLDTVVRHVTWGGGGR